jgi:hypothetical protein
MRGLEDLVESARRLQPRASASPSSDRLYRKNLELKSGNESTRNTGRSRRSVLSALAYHSMSIGRTAPQPTVYFPVSANHVCCHYVS